MFKFVDKLWKFIKGLVTRPGLQKFLADWLDFAVQEGILLSKANNNAGLKVWEDQFFAAVKAKTGELKGTWITILINLAYEEIKARGL